MHVPISPRLLACCGFIAPGARVADIGCDHGYLGIHLLLNNIASAVIAADVNLQPLDSAYRNAHKFGVQDKMSFYLSNGAVSIPRDFDTMVCAGMGADTIVSILSAAPWLKSSQYRLVLQCQSKTPMLRKYLSENGWYIQNETVLRDGKFLYTVMDVIWQPGYPLTTTEWYFPPAIQENPTPHAADYYHRVIKGLQIKADNRGEKTNPEINGILNELRLLSNNPNLSWLKEKKA